MRRFWIVTLSVFLLLFMPEVVSAQDCPDSLDAALDACTGMHIGEVCYGNAPAVCISDGALFSAPGDTVLLSETQALATAPDAGVAVLRVNDTMRWVLLGDAAMDFDGDSAHLRTGRETGCGSGLLVDVQGAPGSLRVNDVDIITGHKVLITAIPEGRMQITPLDGPAQVTIGTFDVLIPVGEAADMALSEHLHVASAPRVIPAPDLPVAFRPQAPRLHVTSPQANVRYGDGTQYRVITTVREGDQLAVIATSSTGSGWLKVRLSDGREGWMAPVTFAFDGDRSALPVVVPPAPPPTAVATVTPPDTSPDSAVEIVTAAATYPIFPNNEVPAQATHPPPVQPAQVDAAAEQVRQNPTDVEVTYEATYPAEERPGMLTLVTPDIAIELLPEVLEIHPEAVQPQIQPALPPTLEVQFIVQPTPTIPLLQILPN